MFDFLKKKKNSELAAMVDGTCIPMEQVKDPAFAEKTLGDGIAIIPSGSVVTAPCDGMLTLVADTAHAFGMTRDDGLELMVHIGIDTVALNGEGFTVLTNAGVPVKKGQPIIEFAPDVMREKKIDMTTMLILLNGQDYTLLEMKHGAEVKAGADTVITYSASV